MKRTRVKSKLSTWSRTKAILGVLGSVQFTIVLLGGAAIALAGGTLVEREDGAGAARALVYGSVWFQTALFLMALNLVAAVLKRIPLKKSQRPFAVTHLAIVLLLLGAWVSKAFGVEGRMGILEGRREDKVYRDGFQIEAQWSPSTNAIPRAGGKARSWTFQVPGDTPLGSTLLLRENRATPSIRISKFLPRAVPLGEMIQGGPQDPPGVEFLVAGRGIHGFQWVLADHPVYRRKDLGPLEVEILTAQDQVFFQERRKAIHQSPRLVEIFPGKGANPVRIPLPGGLKKKVPCGRGITAEVTRFLARAKVGQGGLADDPSAPVNPAAVVEIQGKNKIETHTVFSHFPEFSVVRGRTGAPLVEKVILQASGVGAKPLVTVLVGPKNELFVQISASIGRGEAYPCLPGKPIVLGNLGFQFTVKRFLEHAKARVRYRLAGASEDGPPRIEMEGTFSGKGYRTWLAPGESRDFTLGYGRLRLSFQRSYFLLPFKVELRDFQVHTYPGSNRPADYRSVLKVIPPVPAPPFETVVSMNRPFSFQGYRFFQSSYRLGRMGRPDTTILTVSRDPGTPLVYASFILLLLGVGWYLASGRAGPAGKKGSPSFRDAKKMKK